MILEICVVNYFLFE